jgi:hypothetical protein
MLPTTLPQVSQYPLACSLRAAEVIAQQARRTQDPRQQRALLKASCRLLDRALSSAAQSRAGG